MILAMSIFLGLVNCAAGDKKEDLPTLGSSCIGNCKDGTGTFSDADGTKYAGTFRDGKLVGKSTIYYTNGDVYIGDVKESKTADGKSYYVPEGKGDYKFSNGGNYIGDLKNGLFTGYGTLVSNGNTYTGFFADSKFDGKGKYITRSGRIYEGDFKNDALNGKGSVREKDGKLIYDGNFKDNNPQK